MICKNCGAEYADDGISCPYCHTENRKVALRKKKEILKGYDREADAMRVRAESYVERTANKWTKKIFMILGIIAVIGVVVSIIFIMVSNFAVNREYEKETEHTRNLEELLAASDYTGMEKYMSEEEITGGYRKYEQVVRMYRQYKSMKSSNEQIRSLDSFYYKNRQDWETITDYYVDEILDSSAAVIRDYEEYGNDKEFLGNEKAMEEIYLKVVADLETYGFGEEELPEIALENESARCEEFHEIVREYYWQRAN